jgi:muconolactone D-isomerase
MTMEFLVEFDVHVPDGTPQAEVDERDSAESSAAARLAAAGHLVRLWKLTGAGNANKAIGIYRAASQAELDDFLEALPLADWMQITTTQLATHPNDPVAGRASKSAATGSGE